MGLRLPLDSQPWAKSSDLPWVHPPDQTQPFAPLPPRTDEEKQRRLRIGYVSADFHQHATCILMAEMLEHHDRERFENPEEINFHRERNAHIAFGFGPHSCLGQNITEIETVAFLKAVLPEIATWRFADEPEIVWVDEPLADGSTTHYLDKFKAIRIALS